MRSNQEFKTWIDNVIFLAQIGVRCNYLMTSKTPVNEYDINRLANWYRTESETAYWVRRK